MYYIVNRAQNQHLVLKSYIPGIDSCMRYKICYNNYFSEKLVIFLHDWIEKHPHVIESPTLSVSICVTKPMGVY